MLLLAASCVKEPVEQEPQTKQVPLNITITTKADDGSTPGKFDVNTVRVLVFKNADPLNPTHDKTTDLMVVNEYYPFGFNMSQTTPGGPFTVEVTPTLELDLGCDDYFVYVVLNEDGYTLKGNKVLSSELGNLADRKEMEDLLATPAVYDSKGIKEAPYCLMSSWKTIHFDADKDRPMDVKFNVTTPKTDGHAAIRNMAQITVGSIESMSAVGTGSTVNAELPKIFVLSVELVNVPKDMTWSDADGSISTSGKTSLPIGQANASGYYSRDWGGYLYRNYDVEMAEIDEPSEARIYRTNKAGNDGWGTGTPYLYTMPTPPTVVAMPTGFPQKNGNKYTYYVRKKDGENEKKEAKNTDFDTVYQLYLANLPYWANDKGEVPKQNYVRVTTAEAEAYKDYLEAVEEYKTNYGADPSTYPYQSYTDANAAISLVSTPSTSVKTALDGLFANADEDFWENTKTNTTISEVSGTQSNDTTYCSPQTWSIDLDETYYVPENISAGFDTSYTTCIKVKLVLAKPSIELKSGYSLDQIPSPSGELIGGTSSYWLTNSFFAKSGGNYNKYTEEEFNIEETSGHIIGTNTTTSKLHINHYDKNNKIDGYKHKNGNANDKVDTENLNENNILNYSLDYFFKEYGHIVNPSTGTEYEQGLTGNNRPEDNNFNVYIDFENFYRRVDGLTGVSSITQSADCVDFDWGINPANAKEFYIPVNNNIDGDGSYSIVRNTKYTVNLTVAQQTYQATKASDAEDDFGYGIIATVTTEKMNDYED